MVLPDESHDRLDRLLDTAERAPSQSLAGDLTEPSFDQIQPRAGRDPLASRRRSASGTRSTPDADHIHQFLHEVWIVAELERPRQMRLQPVGFPHPLHHRGRSSRFLFFDARDTLLSKSPAPRRNRLQRRLQPRRDLLIPLPFRSQQNDLRPRQRPKPPAKKRVWTFPFPGWLRGLEPPTPRSTVWYSNQLSYSHQIAAPAGSRCHATIILPHPERGDSDLPAVVRAPLKLAEKWPATSPGSGPEARVRPGLGASYTASKRCNPSWRALASASAHSPRVTGRPIRGCRKA